MADIVSTRADVYAAINTERDYQDSLHVPRNNPRFTVDVLPLPGEITCIRSYVNKLDDSYTDSPGEAPQVSMEILRKIAAMCVRAMEHHGAYPRHISNKIGFIDGEYK